VQKTPVQPGSIPKVANRQLRIAMIGQRGVPATFGGIEHHVEEVGARLAARGHEVTVFCRRNYGAGRRSMHRGMRLRPLPTIGTKHLDAIVHSGVSTVAALPGAPDIIHYHAIGQGLVAPISRLFSSAKVVLTVHGPDAQQAKWSRAARAVLRVADWMSVHVPDETIVVAEALAQHYMRRYECATTLISNGVNELRPRPANEITRRYGLVPGRYFLFVGRLVPDKAADTLIRAFSRLTGDFRLVIVGGSSFTDGYVRSVRELAAADPRVDLTGYLYGGVLEELYTNAAAFVQPSLLEGLPLTVLEAASYGTPIIASDIPAHREILHDNGAGRRLFLPGDERQLASVMHMVATHLTGERQGAAKLRDRVLAAHDWDDVTDEIEKVYLRLVRSP
jgi:glycosyltransferase involved in cell wall biosynthesis